MQQSKFETILEQIAKKEHTSKDHVRKKMQKAMDLAMASEDPLIQARGAVFPKPAKN